MSCATPIPTLKPPPYTLVGVLTPVDGPSGSLREDTSVRPLGKIEAVEGPIGVLYAVSR
jgi:hypothetical protein